MTHISLDPAAWARHFGSCFGGRPLFSGDVGARDKLGEGRAREPLDRWGP